MKCWLVALHTSYRIFAFLRFFYFPFLATLSSALASLAVAALPWSWGEVRLYSPGDFIRVWPGYSTPTCERDLLVNLIAGVPVWRVLTGALETHHACPRVPRGLRGVKKYFFGRVSVFQASWVGGPKILLRGCQYQTKKFRPIFFVGDGFSA